AGLGGHRRGFGPCLGVRRDRAQDEDRARGAGSIAMRPVVTVAALLALAVAPATARAYHPIVPSRAGQTIVLTGKTLTVDQVVAIARDGARVRLSDAATRRSADAYGLLIEAAAEGVPVYWFNRGDGANRQVNIFTGDPLSPA